MKLLLTADIHANRDWYRWIADRAADFDLICIGGDLLDGFHPAGLTPQMLFFYDWCQAHPTPLALCSGNHDRNGDPVDPAELLNFDQLSPSKREPLTKMLVAERWMDALASENVVTDGQSRLLELRSGLIVVTTIPFGLAGGAEKDLWIQGSALRDAYHAPWIVLHHEPPAGTAVGGRFGGHQVLWKIRSHEPDFVLSGHHHLQPYEGRFAERVHETWCFNAGYPPTEQLSRAAVPNHIALDFEAGTASWDAAPETGSARLRREVKLRR